MKATSGQLCSLILISLIPCTVVGGTSSDVFSVLCDIVETLGLCSKTKYVEMCPVQCSPKVERKRNDLNYAENIVDDEEDVLAIRDPRARIGVNSGDCGRRNNKCIVGGAEVRPNSFPWMAVIVQKQTFLISHCGGALITDRWVVSAAHCFPTERERNPNNFIVKLGEHDISKEGGREIHVVVDRIIVHPEFRPTTYDNDIALLRLRTPARLSNSVSTVCLRRPNQHFRPGTECDVVGFGQLASDKRGPDKLHGARVPIADINKCRRAFAKRREPVTKHQFCAGSGEGGIDACKGDSGGPLTCPGGDSRKYLAGIVSWGLGCGQPGLYGVYTDVSLYRRWIKQYTG